MGVGGPAIGSLPLGPGTRLLVGTKIAWRVKLLQHTQNKTLQVIEKALTPYSNDSGVTLGFSTWIVSAMQV